MPFGGFLDTLPSALFVAAHVLFLGLAVWAGIRKAGTRGAPTFWLYALSQVFFLAFFGGALTLKMAVLAEQTLLAGVVAVVAAR